MLATERLLLPPLTREHTPTGVAVRVYRLQLV